MEYLKAFLCGGILCAIGQILIDKTKLTPARILVAYVVSGVVLGALGVYQYAAELGGAGATVPLTGFGYSLAKGVQEAVAEDGLLGALRRHHRHGWGNHSGHLPGTSGGPSLQAKAQAVKRLYPGSRSSAGLSSAGICKEQPEARASGCLSLTAGRTSSQGVSK